MTIGIPFDLSFQSSNVTDPATTLDDLMANCQPPVFQKGLEVQAGTWVYYYNSKTDFTPREWNQADADAGKYNVEPNEYSCFDYDMDWTKWKCRYVKVSNAIQCGWLTKKWTLGNYQYTIVWDQCRKKFRWVILDRRTTPECGVAYFDIAHSSKYDSGKDIKAEVIRWAGVGLSKGDAIRIRSMVERDKHLYLRTNLKLPLEYHTWTTGHPFEYTWSEVKDPMDIPGFVQYRRHQAHAPFDGKN